MDGKLKLKKPITSKKFGVVYPNHVELDAFIDKDLNIFVEHPKHTCVYMKVKKSNIYDVEWEWSKICEV